MVCDYHSLIKLIWDTLDDCRIDKDMAREIEDIEKFISAFESEMTEINQKRTEKFITLEKVKTKKGIKILLTDELLSDKTITLNEVNIFDYLVFYRFYKLMFM